MNKKFSTKNLVTTALLIAIGILIPMIFTAFPFRVMVGPYSATLMAHVPVLLAMFISPSTALMTALGTTIGFLFTTPLIVAIRAASHIVFALVGAMLIEKKMSAIPLCGITGLIHGVLEGLTVLIFYMGSFATPPENYSSMIMVLITIGGTIAHHIFDFIIAYAVGKGLASAKLMPKMPKLI